MGKCETGKRKIVVYRLVMSVQKQVETANKGSLREGAPVENGWGSLRNKILCALIWRDITVRAASSFRHPSGATADCQASATPKNASNGESHPKHFLGLKLIDKTIFCKVSLSKE